MNDSLTPASDTLFSHQRGMAHKALNHMLDASDATRSGSGEVVAFDEEASKRLIHNRDNLHKGIDGIFNLLELDPPKDKAAIANYLAEFQAQKAADSPTTSAEQRWKNFVESQMVYRSISGAFGIEYRLPPANHAI